jgi:hypothetical protein
MIQNLNSGESFLPKSSTETRQIDSVLNGVFKRSKSSFLMLFFTLFTFAYSMGQTTLISPTGDGGFANGSTFAANGWSVSNSLNNPWVIGTAVTNAPIAGNSAYISDNGGITNSYIPTNLATNYFWRDVTVPAGQSVITLSMNYTLTAEASWDIFQVFTAPTSLVPVGVEAYPGSGPATIPPGIAGATIIGAGTLSVGVQTLTLSLPPALAGTTFRLIFFWKNEGGGNNPPAAIDNISLISSIPAAFSAVQSGLWSSPATWGGAVPGGGNDITIPAGVTVIVDQLVTYRDLNINGTVQWNNVANAMTITSNLNINSTGRFLPYTTSSGIVTVNIANDFLNNGYANLALAALNFDGSGSTFGGSGIFQGDGVKGIIRSLTFSNLGSNTISTTQNLILTGGLAHTAGSLNTGGKLTLDNTAQIFGQPINTGVASVSMLNMGSLYTTTPIVFGAAVTQYSNALVAIVGTRYVSGNNVYLCTAAGTFNAIAPTSTNLQSIDATSGPTLLYIGTIGTLGTNLPFNQTLSLTIQYFHGNNVYQAIATTSITSAANMPVHTSGVVNNLLYLGTVSKATVNFDVATGTVRSLTLNQNGFGFTTSPAITFSVGNVGGTGSGATASAVVFQSIGATLNTVLQKSGSASISGGLTINSTQGASSFSGVGAIFTTNGGLNYTVAPTVGFSVPLLLNLVTNGGSGYTTAPTVTVTGGTLITGVAPSFNVTVANGKIVSVYATGTGTYSVLPTLAFSAGNATLAFPVGCLPTATAIIGSNGQISNFNITNAGFGYAVAPTVAIGTTSGTPNGGTFTTVASTPTARIGLYNLSIGWFIPSAASAMNNEGAEIPSNRKINNLVINSSAGATFTASLNLFSASPLSLTLGNLNFGSNTLTFDNPFYGGLTGIATSFVDGASIKLNAIGGSVTRTFPFDAPVVVSTGSGSLATGSSVTSITASRVASPSGTVSPAGNITGSRATRLVTNSGEVYGTAPTVTLNYNGADGLISDNPTLTIAQATSNTGPWTIRSVPSATLGALTIPGLRSTGAVAPTLIVPTGDDFYAWTSTFVTIQSAQSGDWNTPATWIGGVVPPASCENVFINATHTVTVSSAACVAKSVTINVNGTLTVASGDLTVGCTLNNNYLSINGTLSVTGGTLTVNGNLSSNLGSTFNQSGGNIIVDGNAGGVAANSVPAGVSIVQLNSQNINWTAGTLTIVDPHANTSASNTIAYSNTTAHINVLNTHTLKLGNGISTDAGGNATNGFRINTFASSRRILFGNLVIDALAGTNRTVTTTYDFGVSGNLSISANSEAVFSIFYAGGNIINNGTLTSTSSLVFANFADAIVSAATNAQTISGSGIFRNDATTSTANLNSLTVNNTNATGVTLNVPLSVSGTLTMTSGIVNTTTANLLTLGTPSAAANFAGTPSATNMVKGPFARTIATANTGFVLFPVGKSTYSPISFAPTTTAVTVMRAEAFDVNAGTSNPSILNLSATKRWEATNVSGTFTDIKVRVGDAAITAASIPVQAPSAAGVYTSSFGSLATFIAGAPNAAESISSMAAVDFTGFISYAQSNICSGTPNPGVTTSTATNLCLGASVTLNIQNIPIGTGVTYQWKSSPDGILYTDIVGATSSTLTLTPLASNYYVNAVTCATGPSTGTSTPVQVNFASNVVTSTPATRCGTGTVALTATPNAGSAISWYANPTGGFTIATGNSFTTPIVSATTTYYAAALSSAAGASTFGAGATTSTSTGANFFPGGWGGAKTQYIIKGSELISAGFSAGNLTSLGFEITNSGQAYQGFSLNIGSTLLNDMTTTFISTGLTQVYLGTETDNGYTPIANAVNTLAFGTGVGSASSFNWDGSSNIVVSFSWSRVPGASTATASGMKVDVVGFNTSLYRQRDNTLPADMLAELSGTSVGTSRPQFIINGIVACSSPRVAVTATVTAPPAFALSGSTATTCAGASTPVVTVSTGATDYNTYTWSPATGVSGNSTTGFTFNPLVTTAYTLTASQSGGSQCATTTSYTVNVNPVPSTITVTPAVASTCVDVVQSLVATGGTIGSSGSGTIGTDNASSKINTTGVPYRTGAGANVEVRNQYLIPASELTAAGITAGNLTSLAFTVINSVPTGIMSNLTFNIGATASTVMTGTFLTPTFTNVLTLATYAPVLGINSHAFTTPFAWDGTSNIVVQTCGSVSTSGSGCTMATTTTPALVTAGNATATGCSTPTGSTTTNTRPVMTFGFTNSVPTNIVWSPITNLFTNAAATVPYVANTNATTVYTKSATTGVFAYTVTGTNPATNCATTAAVTVTVNQTAAPVASAQTLCSTSTVANLVATGTAIKWYTTATGGTALLPTSAATAGTYYATQTLNTCESTTRTAVVVSIITTALPTATATQTFCGSTNLSQLVATGTALRWYTAVTGGTEYPTALLSSIGLVNGTSYFVSQTLNGCESQRVQVTAIVNTTPSAPNAVAQALCNTGLVSDLLPNGPTFNWYTTATGGTALLATATLTAGNYYVSQSNNGCESVRTMVGVTLNTTIAPTAIAQSFCGNATVGDLVATGTGLNWYDQATAGTALSSTTVVTSGSYYVSQTINGCESARTMVAIIVDPIVINTTTVAACDTYTWTENGTVYTTSGTYTVVTGCNSEILELTINTTPVATITRSGDDLIVNATAGATYQWVKCDGSFTPITGETGETYLATELGSYAVQVTLNGCTVTSACFDVTTLGVKSIDVANLNFYPNPVTDALTVTYTKTITGVQVYDMTGRLIKNVETNANEVSVDMSEMPTSIYIIKVIAENTTSEFRVFKD